MLLVFMGLLDMVGATPEPQHTPQAGGKGMLFKERERMKILMKEDEELFPLIFECWLRINKD